VEQLFASLNELQGQGTGSNAVLELLTVLPEEVIEDQTVSVDSGMRWQFSQEVSHYASQAERHIGKQSFFSYPYRRIGHLSVYLTFSPTLFPELWQLLSHTGAVLEFLLQLCNDKGLQNTPLHERQRKVLRCLLSWVRRYLCFLLTREYNAVVGVQSFCAQEPLDNSSLWIVQAVLFRFIFYAVDDVVISRFILRG
jgi:transportin-3